MDNHTVDTKITHTNIKIFYKNWKNVTSERNIIPVKIWFGETEFHKEEQWFMEAFDLDKNEIRNFALKDILSIF
jgi:predicted DNA-binding transcriptional regulator YafY